MGGQPAGDVGSVDPSLLSSEGKPECRCACEYSATNSSSENKNVMANALWGRQIPPALEAASFQHPGQSDGAVGGEDRRRNGVQWSVVVRTGQKSRYKAKQ